MADPSTFDATTLGGIITAVASGIAAVVLAVRKVRGKADGDDPAAIDKAISSQIAGVVRVGAQTVPQVLPLYIGGQFAGDLQRGIRHAPEAVEFLIDNGPELVKQVAYIHAREKAREEAERIDREAEKKLRERTDPFADETTSPGTTTRRRR